MRFPSLNVTRRRLVALFALTVIASFAGGAFAFPVPVKNILPLSSSESKVTPAHASIELAAWVIDPSSSTVEGVMLVVRNTDTVNHGFQIVVQVSCLSSGAQIRNFTFAQKPFICAGGSSLFVFIDAGGVEIVPVDFDVAIEPERTQIENLSFIVQELPTATIPPPRQLPNLRFPKCSLPPMVNFSVDCLGSGADGLVTLVVENNGPVASGPTTVSASGDATCADPNANCAVPGLAPGASAIVTVACTTFDPDCNFRVVIDPANAVAESNEGDNEMLGVLIG